MPASERVPMLCYFGKAGAPTARASRGNSSVDESLFDTWFARHRPEVVISHAPFVRSCFGRMGLTVPDDVAYVDLFLEGADGRVAGIHQSCACVGETAVEILVAQLHRHEVGMPAVAMATLLDGTWVDGDSLPRRRPHDGPMAEEPCAVVSAA
jgi:LacI family transcriptional regulator